MDELLEDDQFDELDTDNDFEELLDDQTNSDNPLAKESPLTKANPLTPTFGSEGGTCWSCSGTGYTTWPSGWREKCWTCGGSGVG